MYKLYKKSTCDSDNIGGRNFCTIKIFHTY